MNGLARGRRTSPAAAGAPRTAASARLEREREPGLGRVDAHADGHAERRVAQERVGHGLDVHAQRGRRGRVHQARSPRRPALEGATRRLRPDAIAPRHRDLRRHVRAVRQGRRSARPPRARRARAPRQSPTARRPVGARARGPPPPPRTLSRRRPPPRALLKAAKPPNPAPSAGSASSRRARRSRGGGVARRSAMRRRVVGVGAEERAPLPARLRAPLAPLSALCTLRSAANEASGSERERRECGRGARGSARGGGGRGGGGGGRRRAACASRRRRSSRVRLAALHWCSLSARHNRAPPPRGRLVLRHALDHDLAARAGRDQAVARRRSSTTSENNRLDGGKEAVEHTAPFTGTSTGAN